MLFGRLIRALPFILAEADDNADGKSASSATSPSRVTEKFLRLPFTNTYTHLSTSIDVRHAIADVVRRTSVSDRLAMERAKSDARKAQSYSLDSEMRE